MKKKIKIEKYVSPTSTNCWYTKKPLYLKKDDDRYVHCLKQLKERGFSDTETWNLGYNIVEFTLPRLKRFREIKGGYPMGMSEEKWNTILDKMIFAMEWALKENAMSGDYMDLTEEKKKENWKKYDEGIKLFSEWLLTLWF